MRVIHCMVLCMVLPFSLVAGEAAAAEDGFVDPFLFYFEKNAYHIISYFDNDDEFECIEAMIKDPENIRVIFTAKDKTQTDYLNNRETWETMHIVSPGRKAVFARISCKLETRKSKPEISLSFKTAEGEQVDWHFQCAGKPSAKYGGLIDPEGHSEKTSFPVMYRIKSTLGGKKTTLQIGSRKIAIPVEVDRAPFFVGLKSYYSEDFYLGLIRSGETFYQADRNGESEVFVRTEDEKTVIESIAYPSGAASLVLRFPQGLQTETDGSTAFSIAVDGHEALMTGIIDILHVDGSTVYALKPAAPGWASERSVRITVRNTPGGFHRVVELE